MDGLPNLKSKVTLLCIEEPFVSDKFRNPNAEQRDTVVASFATRKRENN